MLNTKKEPHNITLIVRGCENIYICDRCGKEVKEAKKTTAKATKAPAKKAPAKKSTAKKTSKK